MSHLECHDENSSLEQKKNIKLRPNVSSDTSWKNIYESHCLLATVYKELIMAVNLTLPMI